MEKKLYKVYCCFYGGSINQVVVYEHIGELRLDKGHPRLYFARLKRSCIGLECMNKIMFKTKEEAENQAQTLNAKKTTGLEWEKWVREMKERKHWLNSEQVKELNLEEIEVD